MKIISVDPGFDRIGVSIIDKSEDKDSPHFNKENLIFSDCFVTDRKSDIYERLNSISKYLNKILLEYKPDALIIESLYFFKNQKTIIDVASARGIIINDCKNHNLKIFEITPMQIKSALTGHGHADKNQVEFMVKMILKNNKYLQEKIENALINKDKILDDEIDAIACGIAGLAYFKNI